MGDVLDLHHFSPCEVESVVSEFLYLSFDRGYNFVRIIHGKGKGVLKARVRKILSESSIVDDFGDLGLGGGWGATWVKLKR